MDSFTSMEFYTSANDDLKRLYMSMYDQYQRYGVVNPDAIFFKHSVHFTNIDVIKHVGIFYENVIFPTLTFPMEMIAGRSDIPQRFWTRATAYSLNDWKQLTSLGFIKSNRIKN